LSDTIESSFNKNKTGKMDTGKYIIYSNSPDRVIVFEIVEISSTYLKLKDLEIPGIQEYDAK